MVNNDKIVVVPTQIRGWGNVLPDKANTADYSKYRCSLTTTDGTVDGYTRRRIRISGIQGTMLAITSEYEEMYGTDDTIGFNVSLKTTRNSNISGASVKCYVNNVLHSTETTNSEGIASFTLGPFSDSGTKTIKFVYEGSTTRGSNEVQLTLFIGVAIMLSESYVMAWAGETVNLSATVQEYGLDTPFSGLATFVVSHNDSDEVITVNNVEVDDGVTTLSRQFSTVGYYTWNVSVSNTTSDNGVLYIVDFPEEFDMLLQWYIASAVTGRDSQYGGNVDLRDVFNEYLLSLIDGDINASYNVELIEKIDNVMVGLHEYYTTV